MRKVYISKKGTKNKGKFTLVDNDVFPAVDQYNWSYVFSHNNEYAMRVDTTNDEREPIKMHNYIWNLKIGEIPEGKMVDHIDNNGLNNCIENLRLVTSQENAFNQTKRKTNNSGFKGVSHYRQVDNRYEKPVTHEQWLASISITIDGKMIEEKKYFPFSEEGKIQAALWYDDKAIELFGEYAWLNFPDEETRPKKKTVAEINNLKPRSKSGFWGVRKDSQNEKWKAIFQKEGKRYTKSFPFTEEGKIEAAKWYDKKAKEILGDKVKHLNFPDDK